MPGEPTRDVAGRTFKEACCVCEKCRGAVDEKGSEVDGKLWCSKCVAKARRALAKAGDDVAFVAELNATLEADAGRWDAEEAAAAADLARARDAAARLARPLEDKLAAAYRMLDDDPGGAP